MSSPRGNSGTSSSNSVIQTLKWIRKQGFKPVPLHKQSKAAADEKYTDPNYTPPSDDLWGYRDLGIGVVTGPRHLGPVDIDLDCEEAVFFAPKFLPPTPAVFGRKSKPRSHYIFRVETDEFPKKALNDPLAKPGVSSSGSTIIEMRGDGGHQTVFPGSIHEGTGELIEWSDKAFPDVPRVNAEDLEFAVKKIAIATLIVRHMWAEGQRNEICKHMAGMLYYLEWTEDETKHLIQSIMEYTGDEDRTRLRTVGISYKKGEKGGKITGSNTLRTFIGHAGLVDRILEWAGSPSASILQDYNERFAVVSIEGKFRIAETIPLTRGEPPTLYGKDDFLNLMAVDTITVEGDKGAKKVPKAAMWLANPRRRSYRTMDFIPGEDDTSPVLNLWTGWAVDPLPDLSCRAWLDLLYYVVCGQNDELNKWMLNWFANIVREPKQKTMTAPVLIGRQGAGKSLLFRYFGEILGPAYVTVTNEEHIYGRFNRHLATTLLLHSEEALYGGDRKHRGIIKSLITDEYRIFEQKGVDAKPVRNYLRLALTSNEIWAAPTEADDRRFTVIDMEGRKADPDMIKAVLDELKNSGPSALFDYLLKMDYDPKIPRVNFKNEALANLKQINFDGIASWWYECLKSGQVLPDYLSWATKPEGEEWPKMVSSTALYTALMIKMRERGTRFTPDITQFALQINKMTGQKLERKQRYFNNPMSDQAPREVRLMSAKQYTIENLPPLDECRKAFVDYIGQDIRWPEDAEQEEKPLKVSF